jgi:hypothetical protein
LDGVENARIDVVLHLLERADDLGVPDGEAQAPAGHVEGLAE